jgi:hypothetical protein
MKKTLECKPYVIEMVDAFKAIKEMWLTKGYGRTATLSPNIYWTRLSLGLSRWDTPEVVTLVLEEFTECFPYLIDKEIKLESSSIVVRMSHIKIPEEYPYPFPYFMVYFDLHEHQTCKMIPRTITKTYEETVYDLHC